MYLLFMKEIHIKNDADIELESTPCLGLISLYLQVEHDNLYLRFRG